MPGIVIKSVAPWHPIAKLQTLNLASSSLDSNLYMQAGCFMHLILLLDKLMFLNMAEKTGLLIAIMSDSDGDNVKDEWFLNE